MAHSRLKLYLTASLLGILAICFQPAAAAQSSPPIRVAVVGLAHGHVAGFLNDLPHHPEVQLVAIVEPDTALAAKYEQQYQLDHSLFFTGIDATIAERHPQALLVYTSISGHELGRLRAKKRLRL